MHSRDAFARAATREARFNRACLFVCLFIYRKVTAESERRRPKPVPAGWLDDSLFQNNC